MFKRAVRTTSSVKWLKWCNGPSRKYYNGHRADGTSLSNSKLKIRWLIWRTVCSWHWNFNSCREHILNISSVQLSHTPNGGGGESTSNPPLISRNTCTRHVTEHSGLTSLKGSQNTNKIKISCLFRYLARVGTKENDIWHCLPHVMVFRQSKFSVPSPHNDRCWT
jgi:hypothetical protein